MMLNKIKNLFSSKRVSDIEKLTIILAERNEKLSFKLKNLTMKWENTQKQLDRFQSVINVGVDWGHFGTSWAVVCIQGKPEYVNFIHLTKTEAHSIKSFLRPFEKRNITFDSPVHVPRKIFV